MRIPLLRSRILHTHRVMEPVVICTWKVLRIAQKMSLWAPIESEVNMVAVA
jgi:hypothetical protein